MTVDGRQTPLVEGALGFIDALGFKGIWNRCEPAKLIKKFEVAIAKATIFGDFGDVFKSVGLVPGMRVIFLSDTIVLASHFKIDPSGLYAELHAADGDRLLPHFGSLALVVNAAAVVLGHMALGDVPLAYRGTIAFDRHFVDGALNLVVGPAVDEAAELEKLADGAFVWLAPSADRLLRRGLERARVGAAEDAGLQSFYPVLPVVRYEVPLKDGRRLSTSVVDPAGACAGPDVERIFNHDAVAKGILDAMRSDRIDVMVKAQNTEQFLKHLPTVRTPPSSPPF